MRSSLHWCERRARPIGASWAEMHAWTGALAAELRREPVDAILLHYSVFSLSHRGLPVFVRPTLAALRSAQTPLVSMLHEFAFPWRGGPRGMAWALSQRAVLIELMRTSASAVVTMEERAQWLSSRAWLARRPLATAPVFSNLPPPSGERRADLHGQVIGLFGYSHEATATSLVLDALALMRESGRNVALALLGAPGRDSVVAEQWLAGARARSLENALWFSGRLPAQELSDTLAGCDVLLCADRPGPTSRKTTVAASLASGTAVVAIDGPSTWSELTRARALRIVPPRPEYLAAGVGALLDHEALRGELGARGRAFAESRMHADASAAVIRSVLAPILGATV